MNPLRDGENWVQQEALLGPTSRGLLRRFIRRGLASWFVWAPLMLLVSLRTTFQTVKNHVYGATVMMNLTEGTVRSPGAELTSTLLKSYVQDFALTNENLIAVMSRYPQAFTHVKTDPTLAVESMRTQLEVSITDNDFVEERTADDPPRSARITITFEAHNPKMALAVAQDLAGLVVSSTLDRQRKSLGREQAAAASALGKAEAALDARQSEDLSADPGVEGLDRLLQAARGRLAATVAVATVAHLADRAGDEKQTLRFDVVDPGRLPREPSRTAIFQSFAVTFAFALMGALLLAGAFDPRILGREDLIELGIVPLGQIVGVSLPRPAKESPVSGGASSAASSASSEARPDSEPDSGKVEPGPASTRG